MGLVWGFLVPPQACTRQGAAAHGSLPLAPPPSRRPAGQQQPDGPPAVCTGRADPARDPGPVLQQGALRAPPQHEARGSPPPPPARPLQSHSHACGKPCCRQVAKQPRHPQPTTPAAPTTHTTQLRCNLTTPQPPAAPCLACRSCACSRRCCTGRCRRSWGCCLTSCRRARADGFGASGSCLGLSPEVPLGVRVACWGPGIRAGVRASPEINASPPSSIRPRPPARWTCATPS